MNKDDLAIGVDLGGTKTRVALINTSGAILEHVLFPTNAQDGVEKVVSTLVEAICKEKKTAGKNLKAVGIAIAGQVDEATGNVKFAPNLHWQDVPLADMLNKELQIPVVVANDVRAATYGEMHFGAGRGKKDVVCVFVGTGIGGGIYSNGILLNGSNNSAGEVGHMVVSIAGPLCTCGNRGCWEAFAGGWAIAKQTKEVIVQNPAFGEKVLSHANGNIDEVSAVHLFKAAEENDSFAVRFVQAIEDVLMFGAVNLVNIFNPERLIFGGGIIEGAPHFIKGIDSGVRKHALKSATEKLEVVASECMGNAPLLGIASMALSKIRGETNCGN